MRGIGAIALFLLSAFPSAAVAQDDVYDLVIRNGRIVDGTGSPWYRGDLGIRGGHIAAIGLLEGAAARQTVDAAGMVVAPGFIDMLGQSELTVLVNPRLPSKIFQGITTEITGEGGSAGPLNDQIIAADRPGYDHYGSRPIGGRWADFQPAGEAGPRHQPGELRGGDSGAPGWCSATATGRRARASWTA